MRNLLALLLATGLALTGCGKSAEQKQTELDVSAQVKSLMERNQAMAKEIDVWMGKIDAAMAQHDSLVKARPKETAGHKAEDLTAAKEKLVSAKGAYEKWSSGYTPYNETAAHEEAMLVLRKQAEDLTSAQKDLQSAISQAQTAVSTHEIVAQELMSKRMKKK